MMSIDRFSSHYIYLSDKNFRDGIYKYVSERFLNSVLKSDTLDVFHLARSLFLANFLDTMIVSLEIFFKIVTDIQLRATRFY